MPRRNRARRFEPRYGVSQAALEVEAGYLAHEAEDYAVLAASDLDAKRVERHGNCEHCWKHLNLLLGSLPEQEQTVLQCLLFRDFHHILELYLTHVQERHPEAAAPTPPRPVPRLRNADEFSEWLFDLNGKG